MTSPSLTYNRLLVDRYEFRAQTKIFLRRSAVLGPALLSFEGGFLSIESGNVCAVMHATGEWHGRATFNQRILEALVRVPPDHDPVPFGYADGHLLIGTVACKCDWQLASHAFIADLHNLSLLDLLAIERTLPRVEIKTTELGILVGNALQLREQKIGRAVNALKDLGVTRADINALVDAGIVARLKREPVQ
jgi:hypothetical protein